MPVHLRIHEVAGSTTLAAAAHGSSFPERVSQEMLRTRSGSRTGGWPARDGEASVVSRCGGLGLRSPAARAPQHHA